MIRLSLPEEATLTIGKNIEVKISKVRGTSRRVDLLVSIDDSKLVSWYWPQHQNPARRTKRSYQ